MTKHHVHEALDLLAERLDPFIQSRLNGHMGGLDWTSVLQELDRMRGKEGWMYSRRDVALQLRMLTERLGTLGYPFDAGDRNRTLSSYGSVLRIIRNRLSHGNEFEVFDALQASDTVRTVLAHIGDAEGSRRAADIRAEVIRELVEASEGVVAGPGEEDSPEQIPLPEGQQTELDASSQLYGAIPWEAWTPVVVGEQEDLNSMRTIRVRENVRSLIEDIAEAEGPVDQERIARLVGLAFGFTRLVPVRIKKIRAQIPKASVDIDPHGFVWPKGIDRSRWLIHRTGDGSVRSFEQIAPTEIANAIVAVIKDDASLAGTDLQRRVLQQFGRKRTSKPAREQFELGLAHARTSGRIE
ncbi:Swt1 family HEPN domain-containing protein [Arthrobacter citreus]|uniref:Swt1 family HEPN domain-containing protein n=1 Tax=Arthrobacter citreus TaxID=1670 RepID=UPI0036DE3C9A